MSACWECTSWSSGPLQSRLSMADEDTGGLSYGSSDSSPSFVLIAVAPAVCAFASQHARLKPLSGIGSTQPIAASMEPQPEAQPDHQQFVSKQKMTDLFQHIRPHCRGEFFMLLSVSMPAHQQIHQHAGRSQGTILTRSTCHYSAYLPRLLVQVWHVRGG